MGTVYWKGWFAQRFEKTRACIEVMQGRTLCPLLEACSNLSVHTYINWVDIAIMERVHVAVR